MSHIQYSNTISALARMKHTERGYTEYTAAKGAFDALSKREQIHIKRFCEALKAHSKGMGEKSALIAAMHVSMWLWSVEG